MNSFYYTFLKHKELILYIILFLTHVFFAPIYKSMGLEYLFIYDTFISFVYGIFILLFKNNHRSLFLNFAFIEILVYSIFITIYTGTDFGSILFALCCIPCFFFFAYSTQSLLCIVYILMALSDAIYNTQVRLNMECE